MRETSIETYNRIKSDGTLSLRRWEIYDIVFNHGPLTSGEAFEILARGKHFKALNQTRARFTELRDMGVLAEVGVKECSITGETVILWDVTSKLPTKRVRQMSLRQKYLCVRKALEIAKELRIYCLGNDCSTRNLMERFDKEIQNLGDL